MNRLSAKVASEKSLLAREDERRQIDEEARKRETAAQQSAVLHRQYRALVKLAAKAACDGCYCVCLHAAPSDQLKKLAALRGITINQASYFRKQYSEHCKNATKYELAVEHTLNSSANLQNFINLSRDHWGYFSLSRNTVEMLRAAYLEWETQGKPKDRSFLLKFVNSKGLSVSGQAAEDAQSIHDELCDIWVNYYQQRKSEFEANQFALHIEALGEDSSGDEFIASWATQNKSIEDFEDGLPGGSLLRWISEEGQELIDCLDKEILLSAEAGLDGVKVLSDGCSYYFNCVEFPVDGPPPNILCGLLSVKGFKCKFSKADEEGDIYLTIGWN